MPAADGAVASADAPAVVVLPPVRRARGLAQPPEWLWPLMVVLQVISAAALTAYTYFFVDDWLFIAQARRIPLSVGYLRLALFEHFSPVSRILDKLLIHNSTGSFTLAHSLQLLMYAAAIGAFALLMRTILGNRWSAFGLTILFGQSLFLMRLLNWWTATANILPATVFGLLTFTAYLRWRSGRSRWWLAAALVAFAGALLDYETAMLIPVYILVVRLLLLEDQPGARRWLSAVRSEWPMWLGLVVLDVAAAVNYYADYYASLPRPTADQMAHFLVIAVFETFVPALLGIKNPEAALGRDAAVIGLCLVAALAVIAYAVYTRPRSSWCLLAFALIALVTMVPVGLARISAWGVGVGNELYYQQSLQFMLLILVALVLRMERRRDAPMWLRGLGTRLRAAPAATGVLAAMLVAGYGVLYVTSVDAMANASWQPRESRAYVSTFQASVRQVIRRTGREPVLFNGDVPPGVTEFVPYNTYDIFFPLIDSHVRFNTVTTPMYVVSSVGRLIPVRFVASATGLLSQATTPALGAAPRPAVRRAGAVCLPPGRGAASLRIPLTRPVPLTFRAGDLPGALRLFVTTPVPANVQVLAQGAGAPVNNGGFSPSLRRGTSGQYVAIDVSADTRAILLVLPDGACVNSLSLGSFSPLAG